MQHLDADTVSSVAIGDAVDRRSTDHLASCVQCSAEVQELRDVVSTVRDGGHEELEQPGPAVWEAISRELGFSGLDQPEITASASVPAGSSVSSVSSLDDRRSVRSVRRVSAKWLAAAAVVGVVAGGGAVRALDAVTRDDGIPLARTALTALPGYEASGEVTITGGDAGARTLEISVDGDDPAGYREVWLIAPDLERMYSVGLMDGNEGSFTVPADLEVADFPVVDISDEPYDGDPTHSGVSMVRGTVELPGS